MLGNQNVHVTAEPRGPHAISCPSLKSLAEAHKALPLKLLIQRQLLLHLLLNLLVLARSNGASG